MLLESIAADVPMPAGKHQPPPVLCDPKRWNTMPRDCRDRLSEMLSIMAAVGYWRFAGCTGANCDIERGRTADQKLSATSGNDANGRLVTSQLAKRLA